MPTSPAGQQRLPKHKEFSQRLRQQVIKGDLQPGDRLPSFTEMRVQFGISQATVEKIYASLEQDGLVVRQHGRGTFVASPVLRPATGIIGVMGARQSEWRNSLYWAHLLDGVREMANSCGMQTLLLESDCEFDPCDKVDGLLFAGMYEAGVQRHLHGQLPKVSLLQALPNILSVVADDYGGTRTAMRHLFELGHRRIGFVGSAGNTLSSIRHAAYISHLQEAGITPRPSWMRPIRFPFDDKEPYVSQGRDRMNEWLSTNWVMSPCTAIMAHNDHVAVGVIQALMAAGVEVPAEVSVVGFDGTEIYEFFSPRLTTVQVPLKKIGATGAEMLLRQISGEAVEASVVALDTPLSIYNSTGPAPTAAST